MHKTILYLVIFILVFALSIPAYAEVTSFKTNFPFYKGGNTIYFSGTILNTDASTVTVLIFDPNNTFVMLTSGIADNNHAFQIAVDTGIQDNKQKFSLKGVYNATAFVANKTSGKTVSFVFSPDGSPIIASPPTSLVASVHSSTEIDLSWSNGANNDGSAISGYKIERNDGNGFKTIQNVQTTSYQDVGLSPNKQYSYRVSTINPSGTSGPSNVVIATTLSSTNTQTPNPISNSTTLSLDELLKQRMKDAQKLQELLHGSNSGGIAPSTPHGIQQTVSLNDLVSLNDIHNSVISKTMPENNLSQSTPNFEIKNILYPLISLIGVGIVIGIFYLRKKQKIASNKGKTAEKPSFESLVEDGEDYPILIIKNRLAKGEITMDEFKLLKDELSES